MRFLAMIVAGALLLGACGSSSSKATNATPTTQFSTVQVTSADNRSSVDLAPGQALVLTLDSTYWQITGSSAPAVVRLVGQPQTTPQISGCVPGGGCGTVRAAFVAVGAGRADITAARTTCGEAMRCTDAQSSFRVTVVVKAS